MLYINRLPVLARLLPSAFTWTGYYHCKLISLGNRERLVLFTINPRSTTVRLSGLDRGWTVFIKLESSVAQDVASLLFSGWTGLLLLPPEFLLGLPGCFALGTCLVVVVSQFNGTSTPKGSYSAKTGDNDCNVNSSRHSLRTALCESIRYQAKSEQNVRQDLIPRVRHGEAVVMHPWALVCFFCPKFLLGSSCPKLCLLRHSPIMVLLSHVASRSHPWQ